MLSSPHSMAAVNIAMHLFSILLHSLTLLTQLVGWNDESICSVSSMYIFDTAVFFSFMYIDIPVPPPAALPSPPSAAV